MRQAVLEVFYHVKPGDIVQLALLFLLQYTTVLLLALVLKFQWYWYIYAYVRV